MSELRCIRDTFAPTVHDDGMPVPCRRCGAPMVEDLLPGRPGHDEVAVAVRCEHCGSREELPADGAARVRALRERLREIRAIEARIEAPALAIARAVEVHGEHAIPKMIALLILLVAWVLWGIAREWGPLAAGFYPAAHIVGLMAPLSVAAFWGSFTVVTVLARRRYVAELRPALEARPAIDGREHRCRSCGGPIAAGAHVGAFVVCPYCSAHNLLGPSGAAQRAAALEREIEEQHARWRGETPRLALVTSRFHLWVAAALGVGLAANVVARCVIEVVAHLLAAQAR